MSGFYKKVLCATDLGQQSLYVAKRALKMAELNQAACLFLHVIEPPIAYVAEFNQREKLLQKNKEAAQQSIASFCVALNQRSIPQLVVVGTPESEIIRVAYEQQCDLIILGSHGVGGYTHLLGSTAQGVMREAYSDTLIVQVSHLQDVLEKIVPQQGQYLWELPKIGEHPAFDLKTGPRYSSSEHGFGEVVKRGPRLTNRPAKSPYKGGTRESEDDK